MHAVALTMRAVSVTPKRSCTVLQQQLHALQAAMRAETVEEVAAASGHAEVKAEPDQAEVVGTEACAASLGLLEEEGARGVKREADEPPQPGGAPKRIKVEPQ